MRRFTKRLADVERGRDTEKSNLFVRLWRDDCGALLAVEWVVLATVMVLGIIPGLVAVRQGVLSELLDVANAALGLDQSYGFTGQETGCGWDGTRVATAEGTDKVLDAASRVGVVETRDARDNKVLVSRENRGGTQAFTAGSGYLDRKDGIGNRATPANVSVKRTGPCD
jgi:Flp pilus assembly pilin Flp